MVLDRVLGPETGRILAEMASMKRIHPSKIKADGKVVR